MQTHAYSLDRAETTPRQAAYIKEKHEFELALLLNEIRFPSYNIGTSLVRMFSLKAFFIRRCPVLLVVVLKKSHRRTVNLGIFLGNFTET